MSAIPLKIDECVRSIRDFPRPGIVFRDIAPLLVNAAAFRESIRQMAEPNRGKPIDAICAAGARGLVFRRHWRWS